MVLFAPDYKHNLKKAIFLAGPIQDAEEWHEKAINYIQRNYKNYNILCPNRLYDFD